jgi:hypothetical protein
LRKSRLVCVMAAIFSQLYSWLVKENSQFQRKLN